MPAGFHCPKEDCHWEGLAMPPRQACPRCKFAVEPYEKQPKPVRPPRDHTDLKEAADDLLVAVQPKQQQLRNIYKAFALRLAKTVAEKQIAYGDSFRHTRKVLAILYPHGVTVEQYGDLLTITRIIDKLFRVANQKDYGGEDPYQDIAGYATRAACEDAQGVASTPDNEDQGPIDLT